MIKLLKKYQIQITPFEATKNWALNNTDNDNVLLFESTGSDDGLPISLEFIDYGDGSSHPTTGSSCSIALEQKGPLTLEKGLKVLGSFYPNSDPQNEDGTYKRSIYYQVKTMFYNSYLDPTKIWGIENIDFELSKTKRKLSDEFRLVDIPRNIFGDKIIPKTVILRDNSTDVEFNIIDDGDGNLMAGNNLFSNYQEIGNFPNNFTESAERYTSCDWYYNPIITIYTNWETSFINWNNYTASWETRFYTTYSVG